jgi:ribosomal protein L19
MFGLLSVGAFLVVLFLISACGTNPNLGSNGTGLGGGSSTGPSTTTPGTPTGATPTAATTATTTSGTTSINVTITYASVKFTIVDTQQASYFTDDSRTSADKPGALRIDVKEENTSQKNSSYYLPQAVRLLMPDNTSIDLLNAKDSSAPEASVSRTNWLDFAVPLTVDVKQLTLHFGTATEAPIDVLLTPNSDVSKYQTKVSTPNKQTQYTNGNWTTNWTMTGASSQLSYEGKQADKGDVYVVVSLKIDNPSSKDYNGYAGSLLRLQAGSTVAPPASWTIPFNVPAGTTNATGDVAFLVPQGNTDFTMTLLADPAAGTHQTTISFQIQ